MYTRILFFLYGHNLFFVLIFQLTEIFFLFLMFFFCYLRSTSEVCIYLAFFNFFSRGARVPWRERNFARSWRGFMETISLLVFINMFLLILRRYFSCRHIRFPRTNLRIPGIIPPVYFHARDTPGPCCSFPVDVWNFSTLTLLFFSRIPHRDISCSYLWTYRIFWQTWYRYFRLRCFYNFPHLFFEIFIA